MIVTKHLQKRLCKWTTLGILFSNPFVFHFNVFLIFILSIKYFAISTSLHFLWIFVHILLFSSPFFVFQYFYTFVKCFCDSSSKLQALHSKFSYCPVKYNLTSVILLILLESDINAKPNLGWGKVVVVFGFCQLLQNIVFQSHGGTVPPWCILNGGTLPPYNLCHNKYEVLIRCVLRYMKT